MDEGTDKSLGADEAAAIDWLKGRDRVGVAGEGLGLVGGAAAGAAAAGTVAGAAGAATILGSSTLGGLLGGVLVAATPVGWVVGTAFVGGALGYAVAKLARSGGLNDERRQGAIERIRNRMRAEQNLRDKEPSQEEELRRLTQEAVTANLISEVDIKRLGGLLSDGRLSCAQASSRLRDLLASKSSERRGS